MRLLLLFTRSQRERELRQTRDGAEAAVRIRTRPVFRQASAWHVPTAAVGWGRRAVAECAGAEVPTGGARVGLAAPGPGVEAGPDPRDRQTKRHPLHESAAPMAVAAAARRAGLTQVVTPHVVRHAVATHRLEGGSDSRTVQELLGPANVATTVIDPHVLNRGGRGGSGVRWASQATRGRLADRRIARGAGGQSHAPGGDGGRPKVRWAWPLRRSSGPAAGAVRPPSGRELVALPRGLMTGSAAFGGRYLRAILGGGLRLV
jgi:hypothetical protein